MSNLNFVELVLTCEDRAEAERIAQILLEKHLVACAKFLPVEAKYWWKGQITEGKEIMLLMESIADHYDKIEAEIRKLHSYETFVLEQIPITRLNNAAAKWLDESVKQ